MRCVDWRGLPSADVAPLVAAEARAYREQLGWDVTRAWAVLEPARAEGRLPGLLALDAATAPREADGWACYVPFRDAVQVAMLVARSEAATARLVRGILDSGDAAGAELCTLFVRDAAPGLARVLRRSGFDVARYRYLSVPVGAPAPVPPGVRAWTAADFGATAALLSRAYAESTDLRAFAPYGTMTEWREYLASLVAGPGCGQLNPAASVVAPEVPGLPLQGVVLTTDLGAGTAHVAQVVVDPSCRGRGLARALLGTTRSVLAAHGVRDLTLLVAETNQPAARLYADLGFRDRGVFVAALRRQPRRSTSRAFETGGVSTRR